MENFVRINSFDKIYDHAKDNYLSKFHLDNKNEGVNPWGVFDEFLFTRCIKIMNQNNSLKDKLHKSQIKHVDLKNSLTNLETLEYNQRLELGNKNIKIEEITDNLRSKTEELERYQTNKVSINNKLKKYERMNKFYILLCMLLSLIVFSSQIYIRYFTKYRPTIMTWLFTEADDYCSE